MLKRIATAALMMPGAFAWAFAAGIGEYSVGQHLDISGRVSLGGNAPFIYPVIQTRGGVVWVLDGVDPDSIKPLLGKQAQVAGAVSRTDKPGPVLPVIDVDSLRQVAP
ncbi:hypothetical protein [Cupriavidus necator]